MPEVHHFKAVRRLTDNPYLNLHEMDAVSSSGGDFKYYFASRRDFDSLLVKSGDPSPEGVLIYALDENDPSRILLIHQYRYPVDRYIYELPAGLIEKGETPEEAAIREVKEETGLTFTPVSFPDSGLTKPYMLAQGITDEVGINVFGTVKGELSDKLQEDTEFIRPFFADKNKATQIVKNEITSMRAQLLLSMFLMSDVNDPFGFLENMK